MAEHDPSFVPGGLQPDSPEAQVLAEADLAVRDALPFEMARLNQVEELPTHSAGILGPVTVFPRRDPEYPYSYLDSDNFGAIRKRLGLAAVSIGRAIFFRNKRI